MHTVYSQYVMSKKSTELPVSRQVFVEVLKEQKVDIHAPRKDQCDTCVGFDLNLINRKEYDMHLIKKDEARNAKNVAKASGSEMRMIVTIDLQSILLAPKI